MTSIVWVTSLCTQQFLYLVIYSNEFECRTHLTSVLVLIVWNSIVQVLSQMKSTEWITSLCIQQFAVSTIIYSNQFKYWAHFTYQFVYWVVWTHQFEIWNWATECPFLTVDKGICKKRKTHEMDPITAQYNSDTLKNHPMAHSVYLCDSWVHYQYFFNYSLHTFPITITN